MKNKTIKLTTISLFTTALLVGCGGGSSSTDSTISPTSYDLTIERGPVIGSMVLDSSGNRAYNLGNGNYRFEVKPSYPIYATGGYIDVNRDGVIDTNDCQLTFPLSITQDGETKATIVTSLIQSDEIKNELMSIYNLSSDDLYLKPSQSATISAISDVVFRFIIANNIDSISSITLGDIQGLKDAITQLIDDIEDSTLSLEETITQNEIDLVNDLGINLDDSELDSANETIANRTQVPSENTSELTQVQIDDLLFMYQEEKVARDVYIQLYEKWGHNIFNNIKESEQSHIDAVEALLVKYEIEIPISDTNIGSFELLELQELHDELLAKGLLSLKDAIEVGIAIEETDIDDIKEKMEDVPEDIEKVYGNLLNGSYNHLDAFNYVYSTL